jgi:hypothetical protein
MQTEMSGQRLAVNRNYKIAQWTVGFCGGKFSHAVERPLFNSQQ